LLAGLVLALLATPPRATAADAPPLAGTWKVTLPLMQGTRPLWLVKFENKDGKWEGAVTATGERLPKATLENLSVSKDLVRFNLKLPEGVFRFEARVPAGKADKILGTISFQTAAPAELERTTLAGLDPFALNKETLATKAGGAEVVQAAMGLLEQASPHKAKPEEVRNWAARAVKAAEAYGPPWQRDIVLGIAEALGEQKEFAPIALQYARQAERLLDPKERAGRQKRVLEVLAAALARAGKDADAREVEARIKKLDFTLKPRPYAGRKAKSDRAVLVELFTGAQCPPCVAADLAFDALGKTFKPGEVVLLQYHLHIPGPDPLTSPASESRKGFYGQAVDGTPTIIFSGKTAAEGGGGADAGPEKYEEYLGAIEPLLERPAKATLQVRATRKGEKIDVRADVAGLKETGDDVRLRLVLVEEQVAYTGGNNLPAHHHVVRAFLGPEGANGTPLKNKTATKEVTVDLAEVRKNLKAYLDKYAEKRPFPGKLPALDLKKLLVVAFVQNDETNEVLQAAQAAVE
jgi:hypothetical protein